MDKIKDSLTYLFKEKDWIVKYTIPFVFVLIIMILSSINQANTLNNLSLNLSEYYKTYRNFNSVGTLLSCLMCLTVIPYLLVSGWYAYENIQSGIQKRATISLFTGNFGDKLKKSLKYIALNLIFGLILGVIVFGIMMAFGMIVAVIMGGVVSISGTANTLQSYSSLGTAYLILICCITCLSLLFAIAIIILSCLLILPSYLRLIATNTFSEAFKFGDNWRIVKNNLGKFAGIILVIFISAILLIILSLGITFISSLFIQQPIITLVINLIGGFIYSILSTYIGFFFLPRFLGLVYRNIVEKEPSLSYVPLK